MKSITKYILLALTLFAITILTNTPSSHASIIPTSAPKTGTVTLIDRTNHINKTYHHAKVRLLTARTGSDGVTGGDFIIITSSGKRIRPSVTAQVSYTRGATYNNEINGIGER